MLCVKEEEDEEAAAKPPPTKANPMDHLLHERLKGCSLLAHAGRLKTGQLQKRTCSHISIWQLVTFFRLCIACKAGRST